MNFFMPSQKLREKMRDGARLRKRYDRAKMPYRRILVSKYESTEHKQQLQARYEGPNPAGLNRRMEHLHWGLGGGEHSGNSGVSDLMNPVIKPLSKTPVVFYRR